MTETFTELRERLAKDDMHLTSAFDININKVIYRIDHPKSRKCIALMDLTENVVTPAEKIMRECIGFITTEHAYV